MRTWPGAFNSGHLSVKITLDISHVTVSFSVYQSSQRSFFIQCDVRAKGSNVAGKCCEDLLENCRSFLFRWSDYFLSHLSEIEGKPKAYARDESRATERELHPCVKLALRVRLTLTSARPKYVKKKSYLFFAGQVPRGKVRRWKKQRQGMWFLKNKV